MTTYLKNFFSFYILAFHSCYNGEVYEIYYRSNFMTSVSVSSIYHPNPCKNSGCNFVLVASAYLTVTVALAVLGFISNVNVHFTAGIYGSVLASPALLFLGYKSFKYVSSVVNWNDYKGSSFPNPPTGTSSRRAGGPLHSERMIRQASKVKSISLGVNSHQFHLGRGQLTSINGNSATSVDYLTHTSKPTQTTSFQMFGNYTLTLGPNSSLRFLHRRRTVCAFQNVVSYTFAETQHSSFNAFANNDGRITRRRIPSLIVTLDDKSYIYEFRSGKKYRLVNAVSCVHFLPNQTVIGTVTGAIFFDLDRLYRFNFNTGACEPAGFHNTMLFGSQNPVKAIRSIGTTILIAHNNRITVFDARTRTIINKLSYPTGYRIENFEISDDACIIAQSEGSKGPFELKKLLFQ